MGYAEKTPVAGRYIMGSDEALTLITEYETMSSESGCGLLVRICESVF